MEHFIDSEAVVVGAGLSGLAAARTLADRGVPVRVLEARERVAEPWRNRHPRLRLNVHRRFAQLPGRRITKSDGAFVRRDTIVDYLEAYAAALHAPIDYGVEVRAVERLSTGWRLGTNRGSVHCAHVVFATGRDRKPVVPDWKGRESFQGELIHAADIGDVARFDGQCVLVVGAGNSGGDVLNHLARHAPAQVSISIRNGPSIVPARVFGFPLHRAAGLFAAMPLWMVDPAFRLTQRLFLGDIREHGIPSAPIGGGTRLANEGVAFAVDDGFVAAIKDGRFKVFGDIREFNEDQVIFADGRHVRPDAVICATGYRTGLQPLLGYLGVLDDKGVPRRPMGEIDRNVPGLWFTGYRPIFQGYFHAAGIAARRISDSIATEPARQVSHASIAKSRRPRLGTAHKAASQMES